MSTETPSAQPPSTEPPSAPPQKRTGGDVARTVLRGVGQTLITLGVVVLLFVVYEVYVTDLFGAAEAGGGDRPTIDEVWANAESEQTDTVVVQNPDQLVTDPRQRTPTYDASLGEGFAKMYVPAFGADYVFTIIEGTEPDDLYIGPGHYPDTQLPGPAGQLRRRRPPGVQGRHRSTTSVCWPPATPSWWRPRTTGSSTGCCRWPTRPRPGRTPHGRTATGSACRPAAYDGVYGREITVPSDYAQVLPVPHVNSTAVPADAERLITLTTCHPQFSDAERMIIHGVLVKSYAKSPGFLPPELGEG